MSRAFRRVAIRLSAGIDRAIGEFEMTRDGLGPAVIGEFVTNYVLLEGDVQRSHDEGMRADCSLSRCTGTDDGRQRIEDDEVGSGEHSSPCLVGFGSERGGGSACCERSLVRPARLERATSWFVARRSIQLSYGRGLKAFCQMQLRRPTQGEQTSTIADRRAVTGRGQFDQTPVAART
jgi:hypothetical protein